MARAFDEARDRVTAARRAVISPVGLRGTAVEAAWWTVHLAMYPFSLFDERTEEVLQHQHLGELSPVQRGLVVGDVEAAGTPIILIHGIVDNRSVFALLRRGLRRRGFGRVVNVNYSSIFGDVRVLADRLGTIVEEVCEETGYERVHVVGHSMGGQVSIHLAASSPASIERLVLVSASGIPRPRSVRELGRFVTELARPRAWTRPRFARTLVVDALRAGPRVLALSARYILGDDVRPLLPAIPHRTLVLWGALDALTPRAHGVEMAAALPDARLLVLPRAAHIPMVECPVEFNEALLDFLAEP